MEKKVGKKKLTRGEMDQALLDNFINLQKVLTNLTIKFDGLSGNIEKLLQLFEISAKSFGEKTSTIDLEKQKESDKDFLNKLDSLLDQNKTISKGILMMEERVRSRMNPNTNPGSKQGIQGVKESYQPRALPKRQ